MPACPKRYHSPFEERSGLVPTQRRKNWLRPHSTCCTAAMELRLGRSKPSTGTTAATDAVAQSIVVAAANDLAEMVAVLYCRLSLDQCPLALTGSVVLNQPELRAQFLTQLANRGCHTPTVTLVYEPMRGAIVLARRVARTGAQGPTR